MYFEIVIVWFWSAQGRGRSGGKYCWSEITHIKLVPNQMHVSTSVLGVGSRNISCKIPNEKVLGV